MRLRPFRGRWSRGGAGLLVPVLLAGLFAVVGLIASGSSASALCSRPAMAGTWNNIDANTRAMRRADVGFNCGDVVLCDPKGNCTGGESYFTVRLYGACSPTSCDWGTRRMQAMTDGWQRAVYDFGFKTSTVWLKTYQYYGLTYLRVYVYNDFTPADGRADYVTDEWMLK